MHFKLPDSLQQILATHAITQARAKAILHCIDLTNLDEHATADDIRALCDNATTAFGNVAAICISPTQIGAAKSSPAPIATVANFPGGKDSLNSVLQEIETSLKNGADEIDVVMPYHDLLAGDDQKVKNFLNQCRAHCGKHCLKVILETGELKQPSLIDRASRHAIDAGADFIKTSTGKVAIGASLEAAYIMLKAIFDTGNTVGFKASGGIRDIESANAYAVLSETVLEKAIAAKNFRIGASQLLQTLIQYLTK